MLSHARPSHAYAVPDQSYRLNDHERLRQARFEAALNEGFFLRARERMIYLSVRSDPDDSMGWMIHRFVTPDGRLMGIRLPANAQIYVWPVGKGPTPHDSIACCGGPWGRVPAASGPNCTGTDWRQTERYRRLWINSRSRVVDHSETI